MTLAVVPDSAWAKRLRAPANNGRTHPLCWPVSGLTEQIPSPSQARVQSAQWLIDETGVCVATHNPVRLTVAGAAQALGGL